jgi:Major Facilitator Superfamily
MSFAFAEPLITRFGPRAVLRASLALLLVALLWFARVPVDASYVVDVAPSLVLIGIGAGLAFPSIVGLAMSGATSGDAGLASGLVNTTRMVGGSLGLAVMASVATTRGAALSAAGADGATALTGGSQLALTFAAALMVGAIVVAWTVLRVDRAATVGTEDEVTDAPERMPEVA